MTNEKVKPQWVYWRNSSPVATKLATSLSQEKWVAPVNMVDSPDKFVQALDHPCTHLILFHGLSMTDEILEKIRSCCSDVELIVVCDDEAKIPPNVRTSAHHLISTHELDRLTPVLHHSLKRSTELWSLKQSYDSVCKRAEMLNCIDEAVISRRPDGTVATWNGAATKFFGWTEKEALGRPASELLTILNDVQERDIAGAMGLAHPWSGEIHYRGKDKREAHVLSRRLRLTSEDSSTLELCTDISAWHLELRKIRLSTNVQALFQSSLPVDEAMEQFAQSVVPLLAEACAVDLLENDDVIRRVAFAAQHPVLAALSAELKNDYPIFPSNRETAFDALQSNQAEVNAPINLQVYLGISSGDHTEPLRRMPLASAMTAAIVVRGKAAGMVTFISTDAHHKWLEGDKQRIIQFTLIMGLALENQLKDRKEIEPPAPKNELLFDHKDAFLGAVSHELRSPLQAMLGWTQLMRDKKLTQSETEMALDSLELSLNAQNKIVNDLLDLSRINSGKLELSVKPLDIKVLLARTMESFDVAAGMKQIEIRMPLGGPEEIWVMADASWLQRAFWNLFSNAVKFTPIGGSVAIELTADAQFAAVRIADTGIGIAPHFLPHLFENFTQADTSTTRTHYGLGIGLAIARHVVEAHGGVIEAASQGVNQGATFTVKIPRCPAVDVEDSADSFIESSDDTEDEMSLQGIRVLLVEDENDTRNLLSFALSQAGAKVVEAPSAQEGLAILKRSKFDMLISDIGMPQEDGLALIRKVRALPQENGGRIPALALTAYASKEDRLQALRAGYHLHVPKPVDIPELLLIVMALVNNPQV